MVSKKFKGLGRGLDALMGDSAPVETLQTLSVMALTAGKYQPRSQFDPEALQELADSIRAQGLMQPVLVRPLGDERYEIIAGERRWRAAQLAGLTEISALVRDIPDEAALAMALIENIQRENLNALEEATGLQRLIDEFGMTHESAAEAVGKSRATVTNLLRLLSLSEPVRDMLMDGQLDMGHARALLPLDTLRQLEAARLVAVKGLSVRETEALVKRLLDGPQQKQQKKPDPDVLRLCESLSEKIGAKVTLTPGRKGCGRLTIEYGSLDQLDALISKF
ncbi:ParB/RepB/Spo0J family partition protein [Chitinilyticum piscinae]|uniref:ParB/RepB/Spo0J family partition protein n=1 Tax=Chitinilyticum piscinae TaxID=2866724 RepID=A0A8J7FFS2_9NEIS|nr:ParB/RepB/Spo0J family partition protein [Chitinilyticum piscinae]MBE9608215.1 ParB/RepB/Spo0J family partition protein [Chitinilyticum piscinae]